MSLFLLGGLNKTWSELLILFVSSGSITFLFVKTFKIYNEA